MHLLRSALAVLLLLSSSVKNNNNNNNNNGITLVEAISARPGQVVVPGTESRPRVTLRVWGGGDRLWETDESGYVVTWDAALSAFTYAKGFDASSARAISSGAIVGRSSRDPDDEDDEQPPRIKGPSPAFDQQVPLFQSDLQAANQAVQRNQETLQRFPTPVAQVGVDGPVVDRPLPITPAPRILVLLMRFADHVGRKVTSRDVIDDIFNGGDRGAPANRSVRSYFTHNSYGLVDPYATVLDWLDVSVTETEAATNCSALCRASRITDAAIEVANAARAANRFEPADFDSNGDGVLDYVVIVHSGFGAEFGSIDITEKGKEDRIWSHRRRIEPLLDTRPDVYTAALDAGVQHFVVCPCFHDNIGNSPSRLGVLTHELLHLFGLPDLYDTDGSSSGIGAFGVMGNAWGFFNDQLNPPSLSAWSKLALGWAAPTPLAIDQGNVSTSQLNGTDQNSRGETMVLLPVQRSPHIVALRHGFDSPYEYVLIENRQAIETDFNLDQGGVLLWHIDDNMPRNTKEGIPGDLSWPADHYRVAILQRDGLFEFERIAGLSGDSMDVWLASTAIDDDSVPSLTAYSRLVCGGMSGNSIRIHGAPDDDGSVIVTVTRTGLQRGGCCENVVRLPGTGSGAVEVGEWSFWHGTSGELQTCEWFDQDVSRCFADEQDSGAVAGTNNLTARQACCSCGGGWTDPERISTPKPFALLQWPEDSAPSTRSPTFESFTRPPRLERTEQPTVRPAGLFAGGWMSDEELAALGALGGFFCAALVVLLWQRTTTSPRRRGRVVELRPNGSYYVGGPPPEVVAGMDMRFTAK